MRPLPAVFSRSFPKLLRRTASHSFEKLAESGCIRKAEVVCDLGDGAGGGFETDSGIGGEVLTDEVHHRVSADGTDNTRKISGADA